MSYDLVIEPGRGEYENFNIKLVKQDKISSVSDKLENNTKIKKKQNTKKQITNKKITNKKINKKSLSYLIQTGNYKIGVTCCDDEIIFDKDDYNDDYNDYSEYDNIDYVNEETYDSDSSEENYYYYLNN